jgi:hypothetical protein
MGYEMMRFMFGDKYADNRIKFDEAVEEIEKKYLDYFEARPTEKQGFKHDKLKFHFSIEDNPSGKHTFGFFNTSDLRHDIKNEVMSLYRTIFELEPK